MRQLLEMKHVESNPSTFNQKSMKSAMMDKLVLHKSYLLAKAKAQDKKDGGNNFYDIIKEVIPEKGGGKVKGGMKANINKPTMIGHLIDAWGVIRILIKRGTTFSTAFSRDMENYCEVMQTVEDESISALDFESNIDVNKESLKMPTEEKTNGYLEGGATLPPKRHQRCPCCAMETTHYPESNIATKQKRVEMKAEWKAAHTQFEKSQKDDSISAPINKKNGKVYTAPPPPPRVPKLLIVCKADKMQHTRGKGGFKCDDCADRSCDRCKNHCRFVCNTE